MQFDAGFYIQTVLCGISLYMLIAQLIYGLRIQRQERCKISRRQKVAALLVVASACILVTGIIHLILFNFSDRILTDTQFDILDSFAIMLYIMSLVFMYCVIWLRHRIIYTNPALAHLTNKFSRIVSKYLIMFLVILSSAEAMVIGAAYLFDVCDVDCFEKLYYGFAISGPLFMQIMLLSLLIHPLLKHHQTNFVTNENYVSLMKRIGIVTSICMVTDLTSILLNMHWVVYIPLHVNLVVNLICVIIPTTDWKSRLFPFAVIKNRETSIPIGQFQNVTSGTDPS